MAELSLPRPIEQYHDTNTTIEHEKKIRRQKETITQEYRMSMDVKNGQIRLFVQKDGQRRTLIKKESEIKALTCDVLQGIMHWMGFEASKYETKRKTDLVECLCVIFDIPTATSMGISEEDTQNIIQHITDIVEQEPMTQKIIEYIENKQTNMIMIAEIIEIMRSQQIDLFIYIQAIWILCMDTFDINTNDNMEYKKTLKVMTKSSNIRRLQNGFKNKLQIILNQYNDDNDKHIKDNTFWYSVNLMISKFFNHSIMDYVLLTYNQTKEPSPMTDQKKTAIYKYFGAGFRSLQKQYEGKNYGKKKGEQLLFIVNSCLLQYEFDTDDECKDNEYLQVPLRLRLQNRGFLRILNRSFYEKIAINIYGIITNDVHQICTCYDPKRIKQIEDKIMTDDSIFNVFDEYIGQLNMDDVTEEIKYKKKVLKELCHAVTSRYLSSVIKRNKNATLHVGEFRTGIKALQTKQ